MASSSSLVRVFAIAFLFFLSTSVHSRDEKDNLLEGLNSYRQAQNLPPLVKNDNADCIADKIANDDAGTQLCDVYTAKSTAVPSRLSTIPKLPNFAAKCKVEINTTANAIVMPVCMPEMVQTLLLTNYTNSQYAKYLNNSRFVGAGLGKEDGWVVVVLTTGNFAGSGTGTVAASIGGSVMAVMLGFLILGFREIVDFGAKGLFLV